MNKAEGSLHDNWCDFPKCLGECNCHLAVNKPRNQAQADWEFPPDGYRRAPEIVVGVCREDNPRDVDEAYGDGTYARLFPEQEEGQVDE